MRQYSKQDMLELIKNIVLYTGIHDVEWDRKSSVCILVRKPKYFPIQEYHLQSLYDTLQFNPYLFFACFGLESSSLEETKSIYDALITSFTTYMILHPPNVTGISCHELFSFKGIKDYYTESTKPFLLMVTK